MTHQMKLREIYFNMIKKGSKIYEVRLNDEKRQQVKVGDIIIFKKEPELKEEIQAIVEDLVYFKSFEELTNTLPLEKVGFVTETKQKVQDIYHSFYSPEEEQKYGVVAIKVKIK